MVATRLFAIAVHALLHDHPSPVVGDDEAMQIKVEAVLHGGAVDFRDQAACFRKRRAVEPYSLANGDEFMRGLFRMFSPAAADVDSEFAR